MGEPQFLSLSHTHTTFAQLHHTVEVGHSKCWCQVLPSQSSLHNIMVTMTILIMSFGTLTFMWSMREGGGVSESKAHQHRRTSTATTAVAVCTAQEDTKVISQKLL